VVTGLFVALYTTYDAYGIRATADPFTFLMWFFLIDGLFMPVVAACAGAPWTRLRPPVVAPDARGVIGGLIAFSASGRSCWPPGWTRSDEAAVLRETSTVFAALIGWLVLGETVGPAAHRADVPDRAGRGDRAIRRLRTASCKFANFRSGFANFRICKFRPRVCKTQPRPGPRGRSHRPGDDPSTGSADGPPSRS
jgi:hypothetical protein